MLPYFRRTERRIGEGDDNFRGRDGDLPITDLDWRHPICEAFLDGAETRGIPRNPDYNGAAQEGSGYFQRTIFRGFRYSSARAFLSSARRRNNVAIRTNAQASCILFESWRAVGAAYVQNGRTGEIRTVRARREVIVAAGTINTPKLLQISGVGAGGLIRDLGADLVHVLPGVGENLRDHYAVRMVTRLKGVRTINAMAQGAPLLLEIARWLLGRPSLLAVSPSLVHVFWKSNTALENPDLQFVFSPASFREGVVGLLDKAPGMTCGVWQQRPESTGFVHARSSDPFENPRVSTKLSCCGD